jgi:hypothetical protein
MPSGSTRDARSLVVANWDAAPAETPGTVLRRTVPGRAGAAWWPGRARIARRTGPSRRRPQWSRLLLGLEAGPHAANQPAGSPLPLAVLARPSRARLRLQSERPRLAREQEVGQGQRLHHPLRQEAGEQRADAECAQRSPQCPMFPGTDRGAFGSARSRSSIRYGIATPVARPIATPVSRRPISSPGRAFHAASSPHHTFIPPSTAIWTPVM